MPLNQQPLDTDDVTRHCQADHELRDQMLAKGFIWWFMGKFYLTAKGRAEMNRRSRARVEAQNMGLVAMPGETEQ